MDYSAKTAKAEAKIAKYGQKIIWAKVEESGRIDPATGKRPAMWVEKEIMAVKTRPTKEDIGAGLFQGLHMVALIAGNAIDAPDLTDRLRFDGHDWRIREIVKVQPAEECVLYKLGLEDMGLEGADV